MPIITTTLQEYPLELPQLLLSELFRPVDFTLPTLAILLDGSEVGQNATWSCAIADISLSTSIH